MAEKSTPTRILLFTTAFLPMVGGSEIAVDEITKRLPAISFDIITARFSPNAAAVETSDNRTIYRVGGGFALSRFLLPKNFLPLTTFFKAMQLAMSHDYDAVHAFQASQAAGGAWLFSFFHPRARFILTLQEGKDLAGQGGFTNFFRNLIIKRADTIIVISSYLERYARRINPRASVVLIPNGVDTDLFKPHGSREGAEKTVITVSRLVPKNGIRFLVEAMNFLPAAIRLLIVGGGPEDHMLRTLAEKSGLSGRVEFYGPASLEKIPELLARSDVFVRPSLSEGLGTAFLEAMACAVPVIGTAVGGIPDFLKAGETGLIVKPSDPRDIAAKIEHLLSDSELANRLAENAYRLVVGQYTWAKVAAQYQNIYG